MKYIILLTLIISSTSTFGKECETHAALKTGLAAIKEKFPELYKKHSPYHAATIEGHWVVVGHSPKGMRGGGAPQAIINRSTCKVVKVYVAR